MIIEVSKNKTLVEINDEFQKRFPFLKLAFFSSPHGEGELSSSTNQVDMREPIGSFAKGEIDWKIDGLTVCGDLEKTFQEQTNLAVQVMRQSGNIWLQTSRTDYLTLAEQNAKARESMGINEASDDVVDYREQE